MIRPPAPLKRLILPVWNGGHRLAWRIGERAEALRHRRVERCHCCGRRALILRRRWVIPPELERRWGLSPALADAVARKESDLCSRCGARLRARRLADVLLRLYPTDPPSPSLRDWARTPEARALRVALVNAVDGLGRPLALLPHFSYSDFREGAGPGDAVDGVRSEDLMRLSYPDASFDLLITSETLEHVPDLGRALAEVRRVLRPGGRHVFTVPWLPGVPRTFARSVLGPDGAIVHRETPICHPGGDRGYPVFTEFGADLPELLEAAGFESAVFFGPPRDDDVAQVIACRKPG